MTKTKASNTPLWISNLRRLMDENGFNPRSLSLKAGLNATAVRDMLDGRSRFPRYDTAQALADALGTTPAILMNDDLSPKAPRTGEDIELLTEVIARLQEVAEETARSLTPHEFAAMAATIYSRIQDGEDRKKKISSIRPQIHDLLDYEMLRKKRSRG